jgi:hypothetical protein
VFRVPVAGGDITPLTSVVTGVTGITETSPALAVAADTGRLAYSVFENGNYEIFTMEAGEIQRGAQLERSGAAVLPPERQPRPGGVASLLRAPETGLPPRTDYPVATYDPDLRLNYVGVAAATGFGASSMGAVAGGGVAMMFSDMLNRHELTAVVDANARSLQDVGGQLTYLNRSTRWNLGGAFQWIPYASGSVTQRLDTVEGQEVIVEQERISRQINRQLVGITEYPFNRAARLEFGGGLRSIDFDRDATTRTYSATTGELLAETSSDPAAPSTLNLGQTTAALVYDTSIFGATGPVLGTRSRLEVTPTFGSLNFTEVVADVRQYVVPVRPLTLAGRAMHVGRYGGDGESELLTPLFLGYPSLVRGYGLDSFSGAECQPDGVSECPAFDRLIGSRLLVLNAELRFPLVGLFRREFTYGPVPVEGFVFGDGGVAWTSRAEPAFLSGDRRFVKSAGAGVRVNAFGYAVLEFAGAKPFDRPDDGWRFAFSIAPAF